MSLTIALPELEERPALLELDSRTTLGATDSPQAAEPVASRILIGGPVTAPITAEQAAFDDEVRRLLATEAEQARYHLVHLACTFDPADGERFERAWVQVNLSGPVGKESAIAWSMQPVREVNPVQVKRQAELSATLKLVGAKAGEEVDRQVEDVFVEALNLLLDNPTWAFSRSESQEIRGPQPLTLVVKAPAGPDTHGEVRVRAVLRRHRFGPLSYRVTLPDEPGGRPDDPLGGRFTLPGA